MKRKDDEHKIKNCKFLGVGEMEVVGNEKGFLGGLTVENVHLYN